MYFAPQNMLVDLPLTTKAAPESLEDIYVEWQTDSWCFSCSRKLMLLLDPQWQLLLTWWNAVTGILLRGDTTQLCAWRSICMQLENIGVPSQQLLSKRTIPSLTITVPKLWDNQFVPLLTWMDWCRFVGTVFGMVTCRLVIRFWILICNLNPAKEQTTRRGCRLRPLQCLSQI
jgi:hypothetical protein